MSAQDSAVRPVCPRCGRDVLGPILRYVDGEAWHDHCLHAAGYRIIGPDELVRVRSDAIREFCANAKIAPSVEADSLPNDVRQFRLEAAVDARRLIRALKKEGGGG